MTNSVIDLPQAQAQKSAAQYGQWSLVWQRFRKNLRGKIALFVLIVLLLAIGIGPSIVPFNDTFTELPTLWLATPGMLGDAGRIHLLGTDAIGRDNLARLLIGGRVTLFIAFLSATVATLLGILVGAVAGFYGRWLDTILMRVTDFLLALPLLPMFFLAQPYIHSLIAPLQPPPALGDQFDATYEPSIYSMATMVVSFVIFGWMGIGRLVRSSFLALKVQPFVEASRALGIGNLRLILKHILPNSLAPVLVAATFVFGDFIVWESVLAYLSIGLDQAFIPSWGNLIATSQGYVFRLALLDFNPFHDIRIYLAIIPAALIFITVLSLNFIAEALREALDPSIRV